MTSCSGNIRRVLLPDGTDDKVNCVAMTAANWIFRKSVRMGTCPWNFAHPNLPLVYRSTRPNPAARDPAPIADIQLRLCLTLAIRLSMPKFSSW